MSRWAHCTPICRQATTILKRFYSAPSDGQIPSSKQKYVPTTGTYPQGFALGSTHVGVKPSNTKFDDLVLIKSDRFAKGAGTFTRNVFQAAPVTVCKDRLWHGRAHIQGVVINSGCANAVTGKGGIEDAQRMCAAADSVIGWTPQSDRKPGGSLVMSTGVIGQRLPIDKIVDNIPTCGEKLGTSHEHWLRAARAICTTDTFPKLVSREFTLPKIGGTFRMAGIAKGAGMIHPNMGTLLSVICTDAPINSRDQAGILRKAVQKSFNRISIDGDTSTNDTVLLLSNGAANPGPPYEIPSFLVYPEAAKVYQRELTALCTDLAKLIVRDGEGATKFVTIRVCGAKDEHTGAEFAKSIACSSLVKTALYGQDANWGRILCAMGYAHLNSDSLSPKEMVPEKTSVSFVQVGDSSDGGLKRGEELQLLVNGEPQNVDEEKAGRMLKEEDLEILVRLRPDEESEAEGLEEVEYWTCDFSHEYVTINGDYRT